MSTKLKGVCDVCRKEFDLCNGSFKIDAHINDADSNEVLIKITKMGESTIHHDPGAFHACGKHCLFRHLDVIIGDIQVVLTDIDMNDPKFLVT